MKYPKPMSLRQVLALGTLLLTSNSFAQNGGGVRGGEHLVYVNGKPELIDLVKGTACDSTPDGTEMIEKSPEARKLLNRIAAVDWYFAMSIEREIKSLTFCLTGSLYQISAIDPGSPVATAENLKYQTYQGAIRIDSTVFVDSDRYQSLGQTKQALMMVHEALHGFIPMSLALNIRYLYLWTMIGEISRLNEHSNQNDFHKKMTFSHINFKQTVTHLNRYRNQIGFLLSDFESRREWVLASPEPELLIKDYDQFEEYLNEADQKLFTGQNAELILIQSIQSALRDGTLAEFKTVLGKKYTSLNPVLLATAILDQLSPEKVSALFSAPEYQGVIRDALIHLKNLEIKNTDRIRSSPGLSNLVGGDAVETPFIEISIHINETTEVEAIVQVIIASINAEKWSELNSALLNNPDFYSAFGLQKQIKTVSDFKEAVVPREIKHALTYLGFAREELIKKLLALVQEKVTVTDFERLKSMIHFNEFNAVQKSTTQE